MVSPLAAFVGVFSQAVGHKFAYFPVKTVDHEAPVAVRVGYDSAQFLPPFGV